MPQPRPVVLITGASSGIGAAAVPVFAAAGYDVVACARRAERLKEIAADTQSRFAPARVLPLACDVTSDASVSAAFAAVKEQFGALDVLVNNAGYGVYGKLENVPLESFRANFETNVFGVIRCTQAALPLLRAAAQRSKKRWGAGIVMVSSIVGKRAIPGLSSYSATKFALEALSESLRLELRPERIAVSVVNPGATASEFAGSAEGERPAGFATPRMSSDAVARVLLRAAQKPVRNWYLTPEGKAGVWLQWLSPGAMDLALRRVVPPSKDAR